MKIQASLAILSLLTLAGCSDAVGEASPLAVSAAPPEAEAVTRIFTRDGLPGPWWRPGASRNDFDRDQRACRDRSTAARAASPQDGDDAAYRAFLECMDELSWKRGAPPRKPLAASMAR